LQRAAAGVWHPLQMNRSAQQALAALCKTKGGDQARAASLLTRGQGCCQLKEMTKSALHRVYSFSKQLAN